MTAVLAACGEGTVSSVPSTGGPPSAGEPPASASQASLPPLPADIPTVALSVSVGDVVAQGQVTPLDGGTITGTAADGTVYTLEVAPLSVRSPVTVALRPITGSTDIGAVIGGADFAPAGLELLRPAKLTVDGPSVPDTWAGFDYRGAAEGGRAKLDITLQTDPGVLQLPVTHFSGTVGVDVGKGANDLYTKWVATRGDATPLGRQAAAEARYAAADLAEHAGTISSETAAGIRATATSDWMQAESDRLTSDPAMQALADAGRPEDLDALAAEVARIVNFASALAASGNPSATSVMGKVVDIIGRYEDAITRNVTDSPAIQSAATSGRVADVAAIVDLFTVIAGLGRSIQLLGGPESSALPKVMDLVVKVRDSLRRSCSEAPVDPSLILAFERVAQLVGGPDAAGMGDLSTCIGTFPPPTPPPAAQRIEGTLTFSAQVNNDGVADEWSVTIDAVIKEDETGGLAFASGSRMTTNWSGQSLAEGCPTSATIVSTIGTLSGGYGAVSNVSDPHPGVTGLASVDTTTGDFQIQMLETGTRVIGTDSVGSDCLAPQTLVECDGGTRIFGKLIGANPRTWTFVCSNTFTNGQSTGHVTTGGHLTQLN